MRLRRSLYFLIILVCISVYLCITNINKNGIKNTGNNINNLYDMIIDKNIPKDSHNEKKHWSAEETSHGNEKVSSSKFEETISDNKTYISLTEITYTNIKPFLLAKPDTDDVLKTTPPQFLTDVKNPCFALTENYVNVGNINILYALEKGYEIRCLPYGYLAGFTKSGTQDIFHKISSHQLIGGLCKGDIPKYQDNPQNIRCYFKEAHFWDNMFCYPNRTFDEYTNIYRINNIANSFKMLNSSRTLNTKDDFRDLVYLDGTPRVIWHGDTWHDDIINIGLQAPDILLPHKIKHVYPDSKIIVSMRNPTSRLLSDYKFYYHRDDRSEIDFHNKVVDAIKWWEKCVALYPIRACAYGKAPPGLLELGYENCVRNKTMTFVMKNQRGAVCQLNSAWTLNTADRLRVSMYNIYLKDWLEIFPRKNFLFVKFEDYISNPSYVIENEIYPFLGVKPLTGIERTNLKKVLEKTENLNKSPSPLQMTEETKKLLNTFYKKMQDALRELLQDDKFTWIE